jgi:plastocyanin
MATVTATLDTSGSSPRLYFEPESVEVDAKADTITWTAKGSGFSFAALAFDHPNPFSNIVVKDDSIRADDTNQKREDHPYWILYKVGETYYSSKGGPFKNGGPTIRNR